MTTNISQKEYLKKYLNKPTKNKKKIKSHKKSKNVKIIDDDTIQVKGDVDLYNSDEDAPQIAGIIDERGSEIKTLEKYKNNHRWKAIDKYDEGPSISTSPKILTDKLPAKSKKIEWNMGSVKSINNEDLSPPRRKQNFPRKEVFENDKDRRQNENDKDLSPPRKKTDSSRKDLRNNYKEDRNNEFNKEFSPYRRRHSRDLYDDEKEGRKKNEKEDRSKYDDRLPHRKRQDFSHGNVADSFNRDRRRPEGYKGYSPVRTQNSFRTNVRGRDRNDQWRYKNDKDTSPKRYRDVFHNDTRRDDLNDRERGDDYKTRRSDFSSKRTRTMSSERYGKRRRSLERTSFTNKSWKDQRRNLPRNTHQEELQLPSIEKRFREKRSGDGRFDRDIYRGRDDRYSEENDDDTIFKMMAERRLSETVPFSMMREVPRQPILTDRHFNNQDSIETLNRNIDSVFHAKKAGLQDARHVRMEAEELLKRETRFLERLNADISGRDAAPIVRDRKTGRHRDMEEEMELNLEERRRQDQRNETYYKWGRGLKQIEDAREKYNSDLHEMSKPLARYANDEDLERHLKAKEREGDPMLNYVRSKQSNKYEGTSSGRGIRPQYRGSYLPNRFNIPPGHRWDGVDRSNGYEKKWFEKESRHRAIEEEAYKWSTADM